VVDGNTGEVLYVLSSMAKPIRHVLKQLLAGVILNL
jgi:hypothetical protein